jgi:capsid protein
MNPLDKAIAYISPRAGAERMKNRMAVQAYASYEAANRSPRDRDPQGQWRARFGQESESKALPITDRVTLINEIQDLLRNDGGLISTILTRLTDHVVGTGIRPQARTDSEEWNEMAEYYYEKVWSEMFDYDGRMGFSFIGDGQKLLIDDAHFRGESFLRLMADGRIQWFESELCRDPQDKKTRLFEDGLHLSPAGWTYGANFQFKRTRDQETVDLYVPRRDLIHAHNPFMRARQRRGIPVFASVVPRLQRYLSTLEAMQLKVDLEAQQTLVFSGSGPGGQVLNDMPFNAQQTDSDGRKYNEIKNSKGMIYDLPDGRTLNSVETRTPSGEHMPYMESHIQAVSACMGIPYSVAMMLTGGSYAATRGQILAFEHTVARWYNYVTKVSQRTWNWSIAKAIKEGKLPPAPTTSMRGQIRSQWDIVEWTQPKRLTLNPLEDQKVNDAKFGRGDATLTAILKQDNKEIKAVWDERQREIQDAIQRAKEIEVQTGVAVDWTVFMSTNRPGTASAAGNTQNKAEQVVEQESENAG